MPSPTFTERRIWRNAFLLLAFQGAQGAKVDNFNTAASRSLWADRYVFDPQIDREWSGGDGTTARMVKDGLIGGPIMPVASYRAQATPKNLEWLLRSWGGTWSGSPTMTLTLTEALNEWATLALVEKVPVPNAQKLVRMWDGWAYRLALRMGVGLERLVLDADFAGRDYDRTALNALGGITLPASFNPPGADTVFAPHGFRLYRDPAGANVSIAVEEFELEMEQGLSHERFNDTKPEVNKVGFTAIRCRLRGAFHDETYAMALDSETPTPTFRRFTAEWHSGAKSFVVDMRNIDFTVRGIGWDGKKFAQFEAEGDVLLDEGAGTFATFSLTP